jgi:hypothetical protein
MRAMPRLLGARGMPLRWSQAYVVADIGKADYFAPMIVSLRVLLPKAGAMADAEAASFADSLEAASAANHFFAASNFYTFIAQHAH